MFAQVAFPIPYENYFTYSIPDDLRGIICRGNIVFAPLGNKPAAGVVLNVIDDPGIPVTGIKEISGMGDRGISIPEDILGLAEYAAREYASTPGMVFKTALPSGALQRKKTYFYPGREAASDRLDGAVGEFLARVKDHPGTISFKELHQFKKIDRKTIDRLARKGLIALSPFKSRSARATRVKWLKAAVDEIPGNVNISRSGKLLLEALLRAKDGIPAGSIGKFGFTAPSATSLYKKGLINYVFKDKEPDLGKLSSLAREDILELTLWQRAALNRVEESIDRGTYNGFLLYGVTSSGKTQVYIEAAKFALASGKSALILAPEISLTPQLVSRFERALGITPSVWHSQLTPVDKAIVYKRARSGRANLLIGARSAVFSPLSNIGLIIVDEEQDGSYKQDDPAPRYNARDLAIERGKITGATVMLGSATPSAETYHAAVTGKLELLTIPQRVVGRGLPEIRVISTAWNREGKIVSVFPKGFWPVSEPLHTEISIRMKKKEQAIILLNRRGYSSSVVCFECGWLGRCPDCEIGWTYHKGRGKMVCHFCGLEQIGPSVCPACGSSRLSFRGAGTERLEESLKSLFPEAAISRLDSDVAAGRLKSRDILDDFAAGKIDILVGTQMVAKGHHFPGVGLVGVIGADVGLSLPDFRASERVLQLLTQAAGRAGRSSRKAERGLVMIQTFSPQNRLFDFLVKDDYTRFIEEELKIRRKLFYPPYSRLISVVVSSKDSGKAAHISNRAKEDVSEGLSGRPVVILGPARASIFKRGKEYRYQVLFKMPVDRNPGEITGLVNSLAKRTRAVSIRLDVDPVNFV